MNLLANGGFEVNTSGWAATANAEIGRDTGEKHDGVASCEVETDGVGAAEGFQLIGGLPTVRAGESYVLRGWIKTEDSASLSIIWREIGGNVIVTLAFAGTEDWQYFEAIGQADGSGIGTMRIQFLTPTTAAVKFYVDGLVFEPLSHPALRPGGLC